MIAQIGVNDGGLGALFVLCGVVAGGILLVIVVGSLVLHLVLLRAGEFDASSDEAACGAEKAASDIDATIKG